MRARIPVAHGDCAVSLAPKASSFDACAGGGLMLLFLLALLIGFPLGAVGAETGDSVIVIYNTKMPESKEVAEYYAAKRQVPKSQVWGFELPITETMSRKEFRENLQVPMLKRLESSGLFVLSKVEPKPSKEEDTANPKPQSEQKVLSSKVRYGVLCYGVPLKVVKDPSLKEESSEIIQAELRRDEASVEADLAISTRPTQKFRWFGPVPNPFYSMTNAAFLSPTNGILLITRLDGPSPAIAKGLVDKAMQAERDGLWGRAYFDTRGITNGNYKLGDDWIRAAAEVCKRFGFETHIDTKPETFTAALPMSHVAIYEGWYDWNVSGPLARPEVEFVPGAFAYHLHSFSANTLRSTNQNWVGPLLARGATISMGSVDEPYLEGTPDVGVFTAFTLMGMSFGEAAFACQRWLSWQTTCVGDPLYRPFGKTLPQLHSELVNRNSPLVEWSHLRLLNFNLGLGAPTAQVIEYLLNEPATRQSSVLTEKLADVYFQTGKVNDALETYQQLMKMKMSPAQEIRVELNTARVLSLFTKHEEEAYAMYETFLKKHPDYPDVVGIYNRMIALARSLGKGTELERLQKELEKPPKPQAKL